MTYMAEGTLGQLLPSPLNIQTGGVRRQNAKYLQKHGIILDPLAGLGAGDWMTTWKVEALEFKIFRKRRLSILHFFHFYPSEL